MSRWFRFYADAHRNPKVAKLSDKDFRLWVELLSIASEKDGLIPCLEDVKHVLKRRLDHLSSAVDRLISAGLIEPLEHGYEPHGWAKRQYKSDVSTDRVRKHRQQCNVSETPPDTETDTETDITPKGVSADKPAPAFTFDDFVETWNEVASECGLSPIKRKTEPRRRAFKARQREYPEIDDWKAAFRCLQSNKWMHGDNPKGWRADPDFFLQAKSFTKLVEDQYGQAER